LIGNPGTADGGIDVVAVALVLVPVLVVLVES
jgi:hypothetical protein